MKFNQYTKDIKRLIKGDINKILGTPERRVISLGYSCYPKLFLSMMRLTKETELFDQNGCEAWAINEILKDKVPTTLINKDELIDYDISFTSFRKINPNRNQTNRNIKTCITNQKYLLRMTHDFKKNVKLSNLNEQKYEKVRASYERKADRFRSYLNSEQPLIFVYYEENTTNKHHKRTVPDEMKEHYDYTDTKTRSEQEIADMKQVSETIKSEYNKNNFVILYLSENMDETISIDKLNRTVYIKVQDKIRTKPFLFAQFIIGKAFIENEKAITEAINEVFQT